MTQYDYTYHTYPVHAADGGIEPAMKRYSKFPTAQEVLDYALLGLPKQFPLTKEPITAELVEPFLESAITEAEMVLGMNISPVVHHHPEDYVDGAFTSNFSGYKLPRWPATKIIAMQIKFPHTNTTAIYQKYTIPSQWILLRNNRINVVASMGSVTVSVDNASVVSAGGIFTYITGFARGAYSPASIEITYQAGFDHDKLPSSVADLVKTWAAHRFLIDIIPVLFPNSSVSTGIDGVQQSVSFNVSQMLAQRVEGLEKKKIELSAAITKQFGRTIKTMFTGA